MCLGVLLWTLPDPARHWQRCVSALHAAACAQWTGSCPLLLWPHAAVCLKNRVDRLGPSQSCPATGCTQVSAFTPAAGCCGQSLGRAGCSRCATADDGWWGWVDSARLVISARGEPTDCLIASNEKPMHWNVPIACYKVIEVQGLKALLSRAQKGKKAKRKVNNPIPHTNTHPPPAPPYPPPHTHTRLLCPPPPNCAHAKSRCCHQCPPPHCAAAAAAADCFSRAVSAGTPLMKRGWPIAARSLFQFLPRGSTRLHNTAEHGGQGPSAAARITEAAADTAPAAL